MTRRIQRLTTWVQQLARGDQSLPLSGPGQDPVGLLAQAIDELATELHSQIRLAEAERERLATVLSHMAPSQWGGW
jgi:signal transduction histidine kinase